MSVDLTDEERQVLVNLLTVEIEASKFPLSPRIEQLKRIREKLRRKESSPTASPDADAHSENRSATFRLDPCLS